MKRAREYRELARNTLGNRIFDVKWMCALLIVLISGAILGVANGPFEAFNSPNGGVFGQYILPSVGSAVVLIISGPIAYGVLHVFLRIARKEDENARVPLMFEGFKGENLSKTFVTSLLEGLFVFLWSLLFIIPGIIMAYAYSGAMYLYHERNLVGMDAIKESRKLMKGKKWKLFCLDLSFIGWYIVGLLCLGVGALWVSTYHTAARVHFFEDAFTNVEVSEVKEVEFKEDK